MSLKQKSAKLHVLQKQVSQLRYALSRKDGSLHRAAKLFDEYKHRYVFTADVCVWLQ